VRAIWAIARLTVAETARRRILAVLLALTVVSVALTMAAIFSRGTGARPGGRDASVNNAGTPPEI